MRKYFIAFGLCLAFTIFSCSPKKLADSQSKTAQAPIDISGDQEYLNFLTDNEIINEFNRASVLLVTPKKQCIIGNVVQAAQRLLTNSPKKPTIPKKPEIGISCANPQNSQSTDSETVVSTYGSGDMVNTEVITTFPKNTNVKTDKDYRIKAVFPSGEWYSEVIFGKTNKEKTRLLKFFFYNNSNYSQKVGSILSVEIPDTSMYSNNGWLGLKPYKIEIVNESKKSMGLILFENNGRVTIVTPLFPHWEVNGKDAAQHEELNNMDAKGLRIVLDQVLYHTLLKNP